jgi:hypothetical protein
MPFGHAFHRSAFPEAWAQLFGRSLQASCRPRRSVEGGAWHAPYTLSLPIGSYIPVPGIDPAAFAGVMALEGRSVPS